MRLYYCKRLRMLEFMKDKGFLPVATLPDINNPKYSVWAFEWNDDFDNALNEYFSQHTWTATNK